MLHTAFQLQLAAWRTACRCAALPLTCLFSRKERHRVWRLWETLFGSMRVGAYPEVALDGLIDPEAVIELSHLGGEPYNVTPLELLALAGVAARVRPAVVFEFGTANGRSTLHLARHVRPDGRVYTLNLPLEEDRGHRQSVPLGHCFRDTDETNAIVQLIGNSRAFDLSPYFGRCQMVFVDADHFEPGITHDSLAALRMVDRQFGVILWHDALRYDVQTALPRVAREHGPVHLITGTNMAVLCFADGQAVRPSDWSAPAPAAAAAGTISTGLCQGGV
jgi:predicted O-methyltransferase YrrM